MAQSFTRVAVKMNMSDTVAMSMTMEMNSIAP